MPPHAPARDPREAVRSRIAAALDPALAAPELLEELTARLLALDSSDAMGWVDALLAADAQHAAEGPAAATGARAGSAPGPASAAVAGSPAGTGRALPPPTERALVGDMLYAHGLAADRVSEVLAPHVGAWSPPAAPEVPPALLRPEDLASPADLAPGYDAVVIGSGAGGGMAAQVLAEAGARILVLERGGYPAPHALMTDHLRTPRASTGLYPLSGPGADAETRSFAIGDGPFRDVPARDWLWNNNAITLGGGTRVYGAQAWRLAPRDFRMASTYGVPEGSALADWPISYEDLEPFYTRVEQQLGVSGGPFTDPWAGPRSADLPMPPLPLTPIASRLAAAAARLGVGTQPVPLLVNSRPHGGRGACIRCSQCIGFECPVAARAGSHSTTLPRAMASGNATILAGAQARRILVGPGGRARGVEIVGEDAEGRIWRREVAAGTVVLAAGAIESARLLLDSATDEHPDGLGNAADQVGRHVQGHAYGGASAIFEEEVVDLRGPGPRISTADFRHGNDGIIGGGILADEFVPTPASTQRALLETGLVPADVPLGSPTMERAMLRFARVMGPIQEVTSADARVRRDGGRRDRFGRAQVRLSGSLHPEDVRGRDLLIARAAAWLEEAGAARVVPMRPMTLPAPVSAGQHQAGTLRMGTDPATSATAPDGHVWGHENLFVADGSTHVTNGGVNPVLTILANSLRISEGVAGR
ncbi:glucose-methanol-choline oxidoreductase [Brachybacterium phenoliresistens]|uniref:Glucose-methanol-choline oxidoreductase n=1 Tax=Brachybacterium phenoliresistens TaxID=396014 RepID=Z9JTU1_9MICO|nr:GMC family oxidoreductase [Brachybacterium phenoliresistens]EWS81800.1 glucose-methanol-choline oxidoreductase [Brachybacterium phenoliresistens]